MGTTTAGHLLLPHFLPFPSLGQKFLVAVILYRILARNTKPIIPQAADHTHGLKYLCPGYIIK